MVLTQFFRSLKTYIKALNGGMSGHLGVEDPPQLLVCQENLMSFILVPLVGVSGKQLMLEIAGKTSVMDILVVQ